MLVGAQQESGVAVLHKGSYFWWGGWQYQWQELQALFPLPWWSLLQVQPTAPSQEQQQRGWRGVRSGVGAFRLPLPHSLTSCALLRRKCRCVGKAGAAGCSAGPLLGWQGCQAGLAVRSREKQLCVGAAEPPRSSRAALANAVLRAGEEVVGQPGGCWIKRLLGDDMGELEDNWFIVQLWRSAVCW